MQCGKNHKMTGNDGSSIWLPLHQQSSTRFSSLWAKPIFCPADFVHYELSHQFIQRLIVIAYL